MAESPKMRIRLPGKGITVTAGRSDAQPDTVTLPAKEFCILDDVLNVADSASFTVDNADGRNSDKFEIGQRVWAEESDPAVGGGQWFRHFTGRVTGIEYGSDVGGGSVVLVSAMDLGWHLTSCDGPPLTSTAGGTLLALAGKLIDPTWGFKDTVIGNDLNRALKQGRQGIARNYVADKTILPYIQVEPGQTPWQILQVYAQRAGVLMNVSAEGALVIFQPNYNQTSKYDTLHFHKMSEGTRSSNNMVGRPSLRLSIDGIYSESQCWSTIVAPTKVQSAETAANPNAQYLHATYLPPLNPLPFKRRKVFMDPEAISGATRKTRAQWRYQMDQFNSWEYNCEVLGHSSGGTFYTSDAMISLDDTVHPVESGVYYIQSVRRTLSHRGATSQLKLRKPFLLNPALQTQTGGTVNSSKVKAPTQ